MLEATQKEASPEMSCFYDPDQLTSVQFYTGMGIFKFSLPKKCMVPMEQRRPILSSTLCYGT